MQRLWMVLCCFPAFLYAQDSIKLNPVTITDNRLETSIMESGRNVQVIDQRQIKELPVTTVNELLQHVAGVDLRQRGAMGAQADVSIRGGSFDQCLVLINGIKMNDPQTGHHTMNLGIDLNTIKQIEIIKGPAAARYGINAFSGVINIITEPLDQTSAVVEASAGQADNSRLPAPFYAGYNGRVSGHLKLGTTRHMLSVGRTASSGYRENTDLLSHAINYQSVIKTGVGEFNLMGMYTNNAFGASGYYAWPIDSSSEEEVETYMAGIVHRYQAGRFRLVSRGYLRKNFDTYTLFREAPEIFQNQHRTDVGGGEVHASFTYKKGIVALGAEYRQEAITSNNLGQHVRENVGVFAENRLWLMDEKLIINTGVYVNQSSDFGVQILPTVNANYRLLPQLSVFFGGGGGSRLPTFTDLYYVGPSNLGNPDLTPEQSAYGEAGLKYKLGRHQAQLSGFNQRAASLIDWVRVSDTLQWQPRNYESVNSLGLDFDYSLRAELEVNPWLDLSMLRVNYTWIESNIDNGGELQSRYSLTNLTHQLTTQASFKFWNRLGVTATGRYLDRMAYTSYWLVDARLSYDLGQFSVWADVSNLLDTEYIEAANAPLPGRWYRLGFRALLH